MNKWKKNYQFQYIYECNNLMLSCVTNDHYLIYKKHFFMLERYGNIFVTYYIK